MSNFFSTRDLGFSAFSLGKSDNNTTWGHVGEHGPSEAPVTALEAGGDGVSVGSTSWSRQRTGRGASRLGFRPCLPRLAGRLSKEILLPAQEPEDQRVKKEEVRSAQRVSDPRSDQLGLLGGDGTVRSQ